jgi:outer membrane biosynthesis protein TonB
MRRSLIISGTAHAIVLLGGLVAFAARPNEAPPVEPLPVEFVSATEFTQLTQGARNAPKPIEHSKPLADKVGEPKPVKELAPKVADKPEIKTDAAPAPAEAKPEPKEPKPPEKAEVKPEPKPESKPEPKPPEKAKEAKPEPDQIAETLKKEEPKKPPKPEKKPPEFRPDQIAEQLRRDETKKPPTKFDANQVAALLDHREPQRQFATADTLNGTAALGAPEGHASQLSQTELDALRRRLSECWNPPPGIDINSDLYVVLRVQFKPNGFLASVPAVVEDSAAALGPALAESGRRALLSCQPFTMLRPEHYEQWKDISVKFNPHELLGG